MSGNAGDIEFDGSVYSKITTSDESRSALDRSPDDLTERLNERTSALEAAARDAVGARREDLYEDAALLREAATDRERLIRERDEYRNVNESVRVCAGHTEAIRGVGCAECDLEAVLGQRDEALADLESVQRISGRAITAAEARLVEVEKELSERAQALLVADGAWKAAEARVEQLREALRVTLAHIDAAEHDVGAILTEAEWEMFRDLAADKTAGEKEYPHKSGDVTVLGPEIFVSEDESTICWRGENYIYLGPDAPPPPAAEREGGYLSAWANPSPPAAEPGEDERTIERAFRQLEGAGPVSAELADEARAALVRILDEARSGLKTGGPEAKALREKDALIRRFLDSPDRDEKWLMDALAVSSLPVPEGETDG